MSEEEIPSIESLVADFNSRSGCVHDEAVINAASHPDAIAVVKAFQQHGFNINSQNGYYETILNAAIGNDELVSYLLSQGADPNIYYQSESPLSAAAADRDVSVATLLELLDHDAKVDGDLALHWAAAAGSLDKVKILLERGMDPAVLHKGPYRPNTMPKGTALHEAAGSHYAEAKAHEYSPLEWDPEEQVKVIQMLLDNGADTDAEDDKGRNVGKWITAGPGFAEVKFKKVVKSSKEGFVEKRHLERIAALLKSKSKGRQSTD